ncbi:MAG: PQQ-binding-like beta-propeller repeat protein [Planctomycetaceae bacterium]
MKTRHFMGTWIFGFVCLGAIFGAGSDVAAQVKEIDPLDWPYWRGPEMNGISRETGLIESWSPEGENVLWKNPALASRSTPIIMGGKLYLLCRDQPHTPNEGEKVVCADAATGEILWENRFNVYLSDVPDTRVAWSSVVGDPTTGNVFALGVCGHFLCINGETGETIWEHSLAEEYGLLSTYGGRTNFPIVFENLVIINAVMINWGERARPTHTFVAFDKRNGQAVWMEGTTPLPTDTTYSSPVIAAIDGEMQLIFGSGDGSVHGFQPRTGKKLWSYEASLRGLNTTPLVVGNKVICGHSEENVNDNSQGALFALDASKRGDLNENGELWRAKEMFIGKTAPIEVNGRVYVIDDSAGLKVVNLETGEEIASKKVGRIGRASPVYADGKIFTCDENGIFFILKPTEEGVEQTLMLRLNEPVNASPIISHGRIYVTTGDNMYCLGTADHTPTADPRPQTAQEAPLEDDKTPAHVQLVPVENLLKSGQNQQFQTRLFNARGQFLGYADNAEYTVAGPGSMDAGGKYNSPTDAIHAAAEVQAKVGELTGAARVRVFPDFPWSFTFDDGQVPVTWVGARYRHIAVDFDLLTELDQQDPLAARLYIYFMTSFINSGKPVASYNEMAPRRTWDDFLRYLEVIDTVKTMEQAQQMMDASIQVLVDKQVLAGWNWANAAPNGLQLTVNRGPREIQGNGVMVKITTIPLGTRSQGWMGNVPHQNYTVQADVRARANRDKMPEAGLIAQRYRFDMMGEHQQLKVSSWVSHDIKVKTVPFAWTAGVWYTMKFEAKVEDREGKKVALLSGKVWPRDEAEPADWNITWEDEPANELGSPGLTGDAKNAEVFFDNIKVTPNP